MQTVRHAEAPSYDAPKHFDVESLRLQSHETSGSEFCMVGLSTYRPGGRAEMDAGAQEKIYVVLSGEIQVTLGTGEVTVLREHDSCRIGPGEHRAVLNATSADAKLLVIMPTAPPAAS